MEGRRIVLDKYLSASDCRSALDFNREYFVKLLYTMDEVFHRCDSHLENHQKMHQKMKIMGLYFFINYL